MATYIQPKSPAWTQQGPAPHKPLSAAPREAVGVFHDEKSLRSAVDDLMISGFDRSALSLLAGHKTIEKKFGQTYRKVDELAGESSIPYRHYVGIDSRTEGESAMIGGLAYVGAVGAAGFIFATGGALAVAMVGAAAAAGAGCVIGGVLSRLFENRHAEYLQRQLDRGGLLLWVRTFGPEEEELAAEILKRWSADAVHIQELPAASYAFEGGMSRDMSFMNRLGL